MGKRQKYLILGIVVLAVLGIFFLLPGFLRKPNFQRNWGPASFPERGFGSARPEIEFVSVPKECRDLDFSQFTSHITDIKTMSMVVPPGTFDQYQGQNIIKTHAYIVGGGERPIYAPSKAIAFEGNKYFEEEMVQYSVFFMADCDLMFMFDHIQKPVDKLKKTIEEVDNLATEDSRTSAFKKAVKFKSGELVGYSTGTKDAKHWDFGVYDLTTRNFLEGANIVNATGRNVYAACPFDHFPANMAQEYISKFGVLRISEPIPDTFCKPDQ